MAFRARCRRCGGDIRKGKSAKEISPIAFEAVKRIDTVFAIEREIDGHDPAARLAVRQRRSAPLVEGLASWLRSERALLSKHAKAAKAIDDLLAPDRWPGFTRFLEDGRVCPTNNGAERSLRGVALERKSWLFAGSERGIECLQKFLADVRTWNGGIRKVMLDEHCHPDVIERIMAHEKKA